MLLRLRRVLQVIAEDLGLRRRGTASPVAIDLRDPVLEPAPATATEPVDRSDLQRFITHLLEQKAPAPVA
jgi:hypothetical protein